MNSSTVPSIWRQILHNGWYEQVGGLYTAEFPAQVRDIMDFWIHEHGDTFLSYDIHNSSHYNHIEGFVGSFLFHLKVQIDRLNPSFDKQWLEEVRKRLEISAQNYLKFFSVIRQTLAGEREKFAELTAKAASSKYRENPATLESTQEDTIPVWFTELQLYVTKCENLERDIPSLRSQLHASWRNDAEYQAHLQHQQKGYNGLADAIKMQKMLESIEAEKTAFKQALEKFHQHFKEDKLLSVLMQIWKDMLVAIQRWRQEQRLVALGKPQNHRILSALEEGYVLMDKCLSILKIQLPMLVTLLREANRSQEEIEDVQGIVNGMSEKKMREQMVDNCLINTEEGKKTPRQKLSFASADSPVELLVLPAFSNMMITFVNAVIINSETAKNLPNAPSVSSLPKAEGSLNFGDLPPKIERNRIIFQNMTIAGVTRSERSNPQPHWIYFKVLVQWPGGSKLLHTVSTPIAVTTHPNQEPLVWPVLIWQNSMPFERLGCFKNLEQVPWTNLSESINCCFLKYGRGLPSSQMLHLKKLLLKTQEAEMVPAKLFLKNTFAPRMVTEEVVDKDGNKTEKEVRYKNSFGQWLCYALRILGHTPKSVEKAKFKVRELWKQGRIHGFVPKEEMERNLKSSPGGTFMFRFSENRSDSLGLYANNLHGCMSLGIAELNQIPLHERIWQVKGLEFLFPNIRKELAFPDTRQRDQAIAQAYWKPGIMQHIPSVARKKLSNYASLQLQTCSTTHHDFQSDWVSGTSTSGGSDTASSTADLSAGAGSSANGNSYDSLPDLPNDVLDVLLPCTDEQAADM